MRRILQLICALLLGQAFTSAKAQSLVAVYQNNGEPIAVFPSSMIDSVVYFLEPEPGVRFHLETDWIEGSTFAMLDSITYGVGGPAGTPWICTLPPASVSSANAIMHGYRVSGSPGSVVQGLCYGTEPDPTVENDTIQAEVDYWYFEALLTGLSPNTTYYARTFATNPSGTTYGNQVQFTTLSFPHAPHNTSLEYGTVTDVDGNLYGTIVVGTQEWMAENLRTSRYANGDPIDTDVNDWVPVTTGLYTYRLNYPNEWNGIFPYGHQYNWYAVTDPRGVCPSGWSTPTFSDWNKLLKFIDPTADTTCVSCNTTLVGAASLQANGVDPNGEYWWDPPTTTNASGFAALPAGFRNQYEHTAFGTTGAWWTADLLGGNTGGRMSMFAGYSIVEKISAFRWDGLSVRCVRD